VCLAQTEGLEFGQVLLGVRPGLLVVGRDIAGVEVLHAGVGHFVDVPAGSLHALLAPLRAAYLGSSRGMLGKPAHVLAGKPGLGA
jgi:hypothetical protein